MQTVTAPVVTAPFLSRQRIVAGAGFNRWLVPPAALAIHLCIGMAYGLSVFWLPLSQALGVTAPIACPQDMGIMGQLFTTNCDWKISALVWVFNLAIIFLGCSAAIWGGWLERVGPRKAGVVAALCWCGGLVISAVGVHVHQLWLLWLGTGVIGGIGLGLGYISPVSTLIKWFPDRRGMATGMAIMGFGGGAMIGSPLAAWLMKKFATAHSVGVIETFFVLALVYFVFMISGALGYRVPPENWKPAGWQPPQGAVKKSLITAQNVHLNEAWKTPQFWLLWGVLCMNVAAGIGILAMASPILQEVFAGKLIGVHAAFNELTVDQKKEIAAVAAGFTGLLSLFNIIGRFFWASMSDKLGRKVTYAIFFALGCVLYALIPSLAHGGSLVLFVLCFCIILTMYGGGFATIPAYLADMFGTRMVGAIHGRLLTAWSVAGVLGPVLVAYIREYQIERGVAKADAYNTTMYILAGLLVVGFVCNWLVTAVHHRHHMSEAESVTEQQATGQSLANDMQAAAHAARNNWKVALAWMAVLIPLAYGVWTTLEKTKALFR